MAGKLLGLWSYWDCVEAHFFVRSGICCDELFDCIKDEGEILIVLCVFLFQVLNFFSKELVGIHQAAELDEGSHDGDGYLHSAG